MRRRKPRVVWLPQTNLNSLGDNDELAYQVLLISAGGTVGSGTVLEMPCVLDAQQSATFGQDPSLADIESSGYRLRRIVGKVFVQCAQTPPGKNETGSPFEAIITPFEAIVTVGLIVRRAVTQDGTSLAANVGAPEIHPGFIENAGDPWVWRRSWVVGNNWARGNSRPAAFSSTDAVDSIITNPVPANNYMGLSGGVADGPHVDQKTARIVGPEERLFLDFSATISRESGDIGNETPLFIAITTDLRVLGSLRTTSGNRRNASR